MRPEDEVIENLTDEDLDQRLLFEMAEKLNGGKRPADQDALRQDFVKKKLFVKSGDNFHPRLVTILFTHPNPSEIHPQLVVEFSVIESEFTKDRPLVEESLRRPLPETMARIEQLFIENMRKGTVVEGFTRKTVYEYPLAVLREAMINAIVHRDLSITTRIFVELIPRKCIRIYNPGGLPGNLTPEQLEKGTYKPYHRNPKLVDCTYPYEYAEGKGKGMNTIINQMKRNGLPAPQFSETEHDFELTLKGPGKVFNPHNYELPEIGFTIPANLIAPLGERAREMAQRLLQDPDWRLKNKWIAEHYKVSAQTANADIKELLGIGMISKEGKGRSTQYRLKPDFSRK